MRIRKRFLPILLIITLVAVNLFGALPVFGSGVAMSVSSPSNGEFAATTETDVTSGWITSSTDYASGETIDFTVSPTLAGSLANCTSATIDADGDTTTDGALAGFSSSGATYTFTAATTLAETTGVDICMKFAASTTAGIYSIVFVDDNDDDYGATLIYVGDDNDVTVTAQVQPTLSFAIRNSADTADTNVCALGVLSTTAENECEYRLKVGTNSNSGYDVDVQTDGDMTNDGTPGDDPDEDDLDRVTEGTTVTAGTEGYGVEFAGGASTEAGVTITEIPDFDDDDTPLPTLAENNIDLYSANGPNNPGSTDTTNTALMTHRAAIDSATRTGNYIQIVTFYVTASF